MKIVWSLPAEADLAEMWRFIAEDSPTAATDVENRIIEAVQTLTEFPAKGRVGKREGTRELVVRHTSCIVVYRIQAEAIGIVRVWHTSREPFA